MKAVILLKGNRQYNSAKKSRLPGFTLAELLIALGILGIIAVFTVPKVLQANQDAKRLSIFKEDIATLEQITWNMVQSGEIKLDSHSCGAATPIDMRAFLPYLNYVSLISNTSSLVMAQMANGSVIYFYAGDIIQLAVDWDGSSAGPAAFGVDQLLFYFNDCTATYINLPKGKFGTISTSPPGFVAENQALWEKIWQN